MSSLGASVRRSSVPYITVREGEELVPERTLGVRFSHAGKAIGICYRTEVARDRDDRGVLWARMSQDLSPLDRRPVGKPLWASVHPARQRETMSSLRCQKCCGQASRTHEGYLFLEAAGDRPVEGMTTAQPPVCLAHALEGIERCSHLGEHGYVLVRSRVPRLHGVIGQPYRMGTSGLEPEPPRLTPAGADVPIRFTERGLLPWVLASQLVRQLTGVTVVDIDRELAEAGLPVRLATKPRRPATAVKR
ncbi:hypothetical protein [Streptomyces sp. NPDC021020]|uniref:hypothetical protein n=1 Tax=Streptomyces sp. NPDC021020 TaxID=3365109 RepID=UPI0037963BFD